MHVHEINEEIKKLPGNLSELVSDGYHTFKELYEFRLMYNAMLFEVWATNEECAVHKSIRHADGELCFGGGWFIVMATIPEGGQISNHYEMKYWDLFPGVEVRERADVWDGHTSEDVLERLRKAILE